MVTIEDSVVVPVFTLIIISLIGITLFFHDMVITENILYQGCIQVEKRTDINDEDKNKIVESVRENIDNKTIVIQDIKVQNNMNGKNVILTTRALMPAIGYFKKDSVNKEVEVEINYAPDFIRKVNAAKKLVANYKAF